jgi:hypothetical protein
MRARLHARRYLGFFGTLFLPIDIAEGYASLYFNTTNVTEPLLPANASDGGNVTGANASVPDPTAVGGLRALAGAAALALPSWLSSAAESTAQLWGAHPVPSHSFRGLQDAPLPGPDDSNNSTGNATGNGTVPDSGWVVQTTELQVRNGPLETMWTFVYWVTFLLTYIIIPLVQVCAM